MNMHDLLDDVKAENEYFDMIDEEIMTEDEKSKTIASALSKIPKGRSGSARVRPRRFVLLAATIVFVMALSSVAYATDFFGLGHLTFTNSSLETATPKDSNQFKAMKEYNDYLNALSQDENARLSEEWSKASYAAGANADDDAYTITYFAPKKVQELCDKYNLVIEKKEYTAKDGADAISKSGIPNFIGTFDMGSPNEDTQSVYTDTGSVFIVQNDFELDCSPNNVFKPISIWKWTDDDEMKILHEWNYVTASGYDAKCMISESPEGNFYSGFLLPTEKYTVTFNQEVGKDDATIKSLEKTIEEFDFSKLNK